MKSKIVYRDGRPIGNARTWGEVARLIGDTRDLGGIIVSREGSEGPDSFHIGSRPLNNGLTFHDSVRVAVTVITGAAIVLGVLVLHSCPAYA